MAKVKSDLYFENVRLDTLFKVHSGDIHAIKELDSGETPLVACGDRNNGVIGYFDIPEKITHEKSITVAFNGWPLTAKFHPYKFGAKDDVAVLIPRTKMMETTLIYIASILNDNRWRYSYYRKCFQAKLRNVAIPIPTIKSEDKNSGVRIDEDSIAGLFPKIYHAYIPERTNSSKIKVPDIAWKTFNIQELFELKRGDFHSIAALDSGEYMTVSRITEDNGVVGYFEKPDGAQVYSRGHITISTVQADAFVQLDDFIATDNVIVCVPKTKLRLTTLFFIAFMLNQQTWRYSYGRQCYLAKLTHMDIPLPVNAGEKLDEDTMECIVKQASYWPQIERRFTDTPVFNSGEPQQLLPGF